MQRVKKPVVANGVQHSSLRSAAAANGISHVTVLHRIRTGKPGWHYADQGPLPTKEKRYLSRPVVVRGVRYPSMAAASKANGVTSGAITHAIQRGVTWARYDDTQTNLDG